MARIPDTEIERIKREVSVQRLVEASGIALTHPAPRGLPSNQPQTLAAKQRLQE